MAVKLLVNLPEEDVSALSGIAERNGITLGAALRQSVHNEGFLGAEVDNGAKLFIKKRGRLLREIVFKRRRR
jgi:hypothetical protein